MWDSGTGDPRVIFSYGRMVYAMVVYIIGPFFLIIGYAYLLWMVHRIGKTVERIEGMLAGREKQAM